MDAVSLLGKVWLPRDFENGAFDCQDVSDLEKEVFVTLTIAKPDFHRCRLSEIDLESPQKVY